MIAVEISQKTSEEIEREVKLTLPEFAWTILDARGKTLFGGSMDKAIEEMFRQWFTAWLLDAMQISMPLNTLS